MWPISKSPETTAWAPGHCHASKEFCKYSPKQHMCVNPETNQPSDYCTVIVGKYPEQTPPLLSEIRPTADAARICRPIVGAHGWIESPLVKPSGARPAGREVCDRDWGMNVNGFRPVSPQMLVENSGAVLRSKDNKQWVWVVMVLALLIVFAVLCQASN